ncbi:hypothetical protein K7472_08020 [Streptomyces sp. PTM05]|uniref:Phage tail protein n=1 Tax=Streptantibioticus parmotrematis TaxID=2873249 RepID=A0ABS7QPW7_9ACTN|nr:hypothetical protein [Streptantibioticus parmotrematis]MBY8884791.1 hypothetical protein [Streptantibioticus parmotrematis]
MPDYRYIAAHALTGEILHWDMPLSDVEFGPELCGPGSLNATLNPTFGWPLDTMLDAGDTLVFAERNSELLWGGILWRGEPQGAKLPIEASGFTSYLHRRFDLHGNLAGRGPYIGADPCQVIRDVWAYAQDQPDGDLNVTVDDTRSKAKVGTAKAPYAINRWEARNLGEIVDDMAHQDNALEWSEAVAWRHSRAERRILLGAPKLGRRREDLTFTTGANVRGEPEVVQNADEYAQWVVGLGAGDGRNRKIAIDGQRNGRLRLESRLETSEKDENTLRQRTRRERQARQVMATLTELEIADHPAAPFGSLRVGDEVRIQLHEPHTEFDGWLRITGWTLKPGQDQTAERMTLKLERPNKPADSADDPEPEEDE